MLKKLTPVLLMLFGHQGTSAAYLDTLDHEETNQQTQQETVHSNENVDDGLDEENFLVTNT
jgi:hypothetical protein